MAFTADDITRLKDAIATGLKRVRYADGREAEYRTHGEMVAALEMAERDVAAASGSTTSRSFVVGF